jgi:hypothetical protein
LGFCVLICLETVGKAGLSVAERGAGGRLLRPATLFASRELDDSGGFYSIVYVRS